MADSKVWYLSKSVWLQIFVFLVGLLTLIQTLPLTAKEAGAVMIILAVLAIFVRFLTGQPITITVALAAAGKKISPTLQADTEKVLTDLETEAGTATNDVSAEKPPTPP